MLSSLLTLPIRLPSPFPPPELWVQALSPFPKFLDPPFQLLTLTNIAFPSQYLNRYCDKAYV